MQALGSMGGADGRPSQKGPINTLANTSDDEADHLQTLIRLKIEVMTGFAEIDKQAGLLKKTFSPYDKDGSGNLNFPEFDKALHDIQCGDGRLATRQALFERYDIDGSGTISYEEITNGIFDLAPHPMAHKEGRSLLERIRARVAERGGLNGIRTMGRIFKIMDDNGNGTLSPGEFLNGMMDMGINLTEDEITKSMLLFDRNQDGVISFDEFLRTLRGKMSSRRVDLVYLAFGQLDKAGDGNVSMADLMECYDVSENPDVISGKVSPEEAIEEFAKQWDKDSSGVITRDEFLDYYKDVSASVDDDDYFELMIRNAWHISGGEGWSQNTANRRVLVTHSDNTQEVVEIKNDLGIKADDLQAMKKALQLQGVKDMKSISLYGGVEA